MKMLLTWEMHSGLSSLLSLSLRLLIADFILEEKKVIVLLNSFAFQTISYLDVGHF